MSGLFRLLKVFGDRNIGNPSRFDTATYGYSTMAAWFLGGAVHVVEVVSAGGGSLYDIPIWRLQSKTMHGHVKESYI